MGKKSKQKSVVLAKAQVNEIEQAERRAAEDEQFQQELDRFTLMLDGYISRFERRLEDKLNECVPDRVNRSFPYLKPDLNAADGMGHHRAWLDYRAAIQNYIRHCTNMAGDRGRQHAQYPDHVLPKLDNEVIDLVKIYENLHHIFEMSFDRAKRPGERVEAVVRVVKHGIPAEHGHKSVQLFLDPKYADTATAKRLMKDIFGIFGEGKLSGGLLAAQGLYSKPIIRERMGDKSRRRKGSLKR